VTLRSVRSLLVVVITAAVAVTVAPATAAARQAGGVGAVAMRSGDGLQVLDLSAHDERTLDVRVATPLVSDGATRKGNGVRIVLPEGYDPSSPRRYPVLYLLHGATGSYTTWDDSAAADIRRSSGSDLIIVMPDGGKIGFYTDWVDQARYRQSWLTYHLDQLVPFVDRNLKTIPDRRSRAIAGVSMGGAGAFRYTFERPDLFGAVASFSGYLDIHAPLGVTALGGMNAAWQMPTFGQYGLPFWPYWDTWRAANPVGHAPRFRGVTTLLYVGEGTDPAEQLVRTMTETMSRALTRAGVDHTAVNYGRPGGGCNGGHEPGCGPHALALAMPHLRAALSLPAVATSGAGS
jgi:S-formylglutathione hydrolase FrmB